MPDIQLGLSNQETIDMANAAHKFLNRNNTNIASRIVVTDSNGKLISSGASANNVPMQPVNSDSSPVFANATIGGNDINAKIGLLDSSLGQPVNSDSDVNFNSVNDVFVSLNGGANDVYIRNGLTARDARGLVIDENKSLSDKADKSQIITFDRAIYRQIGDVTVANTTVKSTLLSGNAASRTIAGGTLKAGDYVSITNKGKMSTSNINDKAKVEVLFNGVDLLQSSQLQLAGSVLTNDLFANEFDIKIITAGVNGTAQLSGYTMMHPGSGIASPVMRESSGSIVTIDTTKNIIIDVTYQWDQANAGCSITMTHSKMVLSQ